MLILTIQKESIVNSIMSGTTYKANFYKTNYGCISPLYTKGYNKIKGALSRKLKRELSSEDSPIWGWVDTPFLEFHKYDKSEKLVAMFVDIPEEQVVLSDYDKFCDYIEGRSSSSNFIIKDGSVISPNMCVQACFLGIKPEDVLLTIDYVYLKDNVDNNLERLYNSCRLYNLYCSLKEKH